jgi:sulfur dioxygenase
MESCTFTYLIADNKEAILIDPVLEHVNRDLSLIDQLGFELKYVLNTHCHADHLTSSGLIKRKFSNVKSIISKESGAEADILLNAGELIQFNNVQLIAIDTPGHTNGCMSFYSKRLGAVFTGDSLLIRGCGRTDFQKGDSSLLYDSIHQKLFQLPRETIVYPGHDYKGNTCSTIGEEIEHNPRLSKSKDEFINLMKDLGLPFPKKMDIAVPFNMKCGIQ